MPAQAHLPVQDAQSRVNPRDLQNIAELGHCYCSCVIHLHTYIYIHTGYIHIYIPRINDLRAARLSYFAVVSLLPQLNAISHAELSSIAECGQEGRSSVFLDLQQAWEKLALPLPFATSFNSFEVRQAPARHCETQFKVQRSSTVHFSAPRHKSCLVQTPHGNPAKPYRSGELFYVAKSRWMARSLPLAISQVPRNRIRSLRPWPQESTLKH